MSSITPKATLGVLLVVHGAAAGEERFEDLSARVDHLPATIDRGDVWRAIAFGLVLMDHVRAMDPVWTRDRDDAYRGVERAIKRLRRVLAKHELDQHIERLELELAALMAGGPLESDQLRRGSTRDDLSPTRGGRPRDLWRESTLERLKTAGVTAEAARDLLDAAGLLPRTPTRED